MRKLTLFPMFAIGAVLVAGCGSASTSGSNATGVASATSTSTSPPAAAASTPTSISRSGTGVNPNAPESLPPGDIPDTTAYVAYAVPGADYTVSTPEGWSRTTVGGVVSFTSNLNAVRISAASAHGPVTAASVRRDLLLKLPSSLRGFKLESATSVKRTAGTAIRSLYLGFSPRNPVTNKFGVLAFERYDFPHSGRVITLVLSSPVGSDNVDPWRKITNSLAFTR